MSMRIFQEARKKILRQAQWEYGYTYRERREREDEEQRLRLMGAENWTNEDVEANRAFQKEKIRRCCEHSVLKKAKNLLSLVAFSHIDQKEEIAKRTLTDFMLQLQVRGRFNTFRM